MECFILAATIFVYSPGPPSGVLILPIDGERRAIGVLEYGHGSVEIDTDIGSIRLGDAAPRELFDLIKSCQRIDSGG